MYAKNVLEKCNQKVKILLFSHEYNVPKERLILQPKYNFKDMYENNERRNFNIASC